MNFKYEFDDWLSGQINRDFENGLIPELQTKHVIKGRLPRKVLLKSQNNSTPNYLSQEEYKNIESYQEKAFDKGVKLVAKFKINEFKSILASKSSKAVEESVKEEIDIVTEIINGADTKDRLEVNHQGKPIEGLDYWKAKKINNLTEPDGRMTLSFYTNTGILRFNSTFELYIRHKYKEKLEKLLDEGVSNKKDNFDKLNGTAKRCINLFLEENRFKANNDEIAKLFLTSFEIRSSEEFGKPKLGKVAPTVENVLDHKSFTCQGEMPSERQLGKYLKKYWFDYRAPQ